jgi:hypothetical protein
MKWKYRWQKKQDASGYVNQLSLRQFKTWSHQFRFTDFINVPVLRDYQITLTMSINKSDPKYCPWLWIQLSSVVYLSQRVADLNRNDRPDWIGMGGRFASEYAKVLKLLFLPPYSPDLNPIEKVWKLTRRLCTHNQYFPQLQDLVTAVSNQMKLWQRPNNILVKLCGII